MRATPSPDDQAGVPASSTRGEWLKVGASLAAIAPVLSLGKEDALAAATSGEKALAVFRRLRPKWCAFVHSS